MLRRLALLLFLELNGAAVFGAGSVQDFRQEAPTDLTLGHIVLHGETSHRALDGSWLKVRMKSNKGIFDYHITRVGGGGGPLPPIKANPLVFDGEITAMAHGGTDWEGVFTFGGQTGRLRFQLVDDRPRSEEPAPTYRNVAYGPYPRDIMDVYLAKSDHPTPIAIYIHGGAWTAGDKSDLAHYREFLDAGISVFAIDYRYCPPANPDAATPAVALPLRDAARAVQFIRSQAGSWNLDPKRLGLWGISAGACTSLWLATHPDLADPSAADPIARESSRPSCVAVLWAQTSLDPVEMRAWVGPELAYGAQAFGISAGRARADFERFIAARPRILKWIAEYSPSALLATGKGPPIFLDYLDFGLTPCEPLGAYYTHSPRFGVGFIQRCREVGRECYLRYDGREDSRYASWQAFLLARLRQ